MSRYTAPPAGLRSLDPLPVAPYRRWNGAVWPVAWVESYNWELARIARRHEDGYDVTHLVDGLYNLARTFDHSARHDERA